jgi:hypothetical protein
MEAETISKNGASSKSQMSRRNIFKYFGIIALAAVITVIVCSFGVTSQTERWEYQVVCTSDFNLNTEMKLDATKKKLNSLGNEGWEVISVISGHWRYSDDVLFTLKRRVR